LAETAAEFHRFRFQNHAGFGAQGTGHTARILANSHFLRLKVCAILPLAMSGPITVFTHILHLLMGDC
jgi:hypothetical protein